MDMLRKLYHIFEDFGENIQTQTTTYVNGLRRLAEVVMDTLNQIGGGQEQNKGKFNQNSPMNTKFSKIRFCQPTPSPTDYNFTLTSYKGCHISEGQ